MVNISELFKRTIVKYSYGSHVYGTNDEKSDFDYICVVDDECDFSEKEFQTKENDIDYTFIKKRDFIQEIINNEISALECIFLPEKYYEGDNSEFISLFSYDEEKLRKSISATCSNSFVKAKKKLVIQKDYDFRKSMKSLFHSIRIFDFGIQIAEHGKIIDYQSMNHLWIDSISKENSQDWEYYKNKYKPIYNEYHSKFVKLARKSV